MCGEDLFYHELIQLYYRVNIGTSTAGFASRNIKKGEEITDCFSWAYDITKFEDRSVLSKEFGIT